MDLNLLEIPENKIKQLKAKGINTIEELVALYPTKYNDYGKILTIKEAEKRENETVTIMGQITKITRGMKYVQATVVDDEGSQINIVWFNQTYIEKTLMRNIPYIFSGKITYNYGYGNYSITPIYYTSHLEEFCPLSPVYPKVKGMAGEYLSNCIKKGISLILADSKDYDYMEPDLVQRLGVLPYKEFLVKVHSPENNSDISLADKRKIVDNLFPFVMKMTDRKQGYVGKSAYTATTKDRLNKFIKSLPFELTEGQSDAINSLSQKMIEGKRVDALVQGDVGCGKTIIATAMAVFAADNGYQAVLMCPTSVLAQQHYAKIKAQLEPLGFSVALLISDMKAAEKRKALQEIKDGKHQIIIGTHSVISKDVEFNNLALTIVDEEHRFGVEQREMLKEKSAKGVHNISMSATPIPRTLALTIYGENTEVINIYTKPQGRKPVKTIIYSDEDKICRSMHRQIMMGHQCYVVCPLIEESETEKMADVESVDAAYKKMFQWFMRDMNVNVDVITGNMKQAEIKQHLEDFAKNKTQILISTTIVEVGVDVPNATVIVIKSPERFGLAQLHQLRGRVGRGDAQSYCVLQSKETFNPRLRAMVETNDGFEIAERDMQLRGTGNVVGTKQSGVDKYITLMLQNQRLYSYLCKEAEDIFSKPNRFERYCHLLKIQED